jgi:MFS family permease
MTGLFIILGFIGSAVLAVVAGFVAIFNRTISRAQRLTYFIIASVAIAAGIWSTYGYDYYSNPNTHMYGWPIPYVIFQRKNPEAPWLDYFGITAILALPMNWVIFLFLPSAAIVVVSVIQKKKKANQSLQS